MGAFQFLPCREDMLRPISQAGRVGVNLPIAACEDGERASEFKA
jgi:hypothetical protein